MSLGVDGATLILGDGDQQVTALDQVSLQVEPGSLVAVVGPSGAGKSSLLAVCGGLRPPTQGRVTIDGTEITSLNRRRLSEIRRTRIGFVFQESNLVPALTALDQLLLMVHLSGKRPGPQDRQRATALLEEVGMSSRIDRRSDQLSGGERQRVGIARALMTHPKVLLVDEPTSMLDRDRGRQIVALLASRCHEHGVATLMVTHDHGMLDYADRTTTISDGRLGESDAQD